MMNQLTFTKESTPDGCKIHLKGKINSATKLEELTQTLAGAANVWINFQEVVLFDSSGIRNWILFLNQNTKTNFFYQNCPSWMVKQFSTVQGLVRKNAQVFSFYAPYISKDTHEEMELLLEVSKLDRKKLPRPLPKNGQELEFNGVEEKFLHFLDLQNK